MALIVQKYGGTSVGNVDRIQNVAAKIKEQWSQGHHLVVVVSARSGVTNDLIARAKYLVEPTDRAAYAALWQRAFGTRARDLGLLYGLGRDLAESKDWPNWAQDAEFRATRDASASKRR